MTTILLGHAELMSGSPRTESGENMPLASWYRVSTPAGAASYVAATPHGLYRCNPLGQTHDFFDCLYERRALDSTADALRNIGFEVAL